MPARKKFQGHTKSPAVQEGSPSRFDNMDPERARELQSKGGKKSVQVRRERKAMREDIDMILNAAVKNGPLQELTGEEDLSQMVGMNTTIQQQMIFALIQKTLSQDSKAVEAFETLRDSVGEKPVDEHRYQDVTPVIISGEAELAD